MANKLKHVVLFGFKTADGAARVEEIVARFRALPGLVPGIDAFEWGTDVSPEGLGQGHSHCFTLTFSTEAERDAYLVHPDHRAFVEFAGPSIEKALVVDYWAQG